MTIIKPSEKILQAMEIIGSPERWTKGTFARDSDGVSTVYYSSKAVCFCSIGALEKVKAAYSAKYYIARSLPKDASSSGIVKYNDAPETKHKDVMNMFMTAAFLALSEGK